jgi:hypothetical protein
LTASPGANCQIETAASLNSEWSPFQTVQIPATGQIEIPISTPQPAAFFRANLQP